MRNAVDLIFLRSYWSDKIREGEMDWLCSLCGREVKSTYIFSWKNLRSERDQMWNLSVEVKIIWNGP